MRITIQYEASWQNSFLDGSNNEPIPKSGRKFVGSMTNLSKRNAEGKYPNFLERQVSLDTVIGILNRLIGDQRKLYQSRQSQGYFFSEMESCVRYKNLQNKSVLNKEMIFIRNMTGSTDQNSFAGAVKSSDPIFNSDYSDELWGVLTLDFETLCQFIIQFDFSVINRKRFYPLCVLKQLNRLKKLKTIKVTSYIAQALTALQSHFSGTEYLDAKAMIKPITFYCSALYLQIGRLSQRFDLSNSLTKNGGLSGMSKRGFTPKDFMARYTSGDKKLIFGNPYLLREKRKGEGEVVSMLTKASGILEIQLDISTEKATQLKEMIEAAGVSSFYLGKKGLAYVSEIRI
ncbi:MAG: hypothetical protein ACD_60C00079G0049 [uncultured bacterium]|nr:MAG: hypothetical protein ACD_60C00079G0049 [uncultured bacterium]